MSLPELSTLLLRHFKKIALLLSCAVFFSFVPTQTFAQSDYSPPASSTVAASTDADYARIQALLIHVSAAFICQLSGIDVLNPQQGCLGVNPTTHQLGFASPSSQPQLGGLLGFSTSAIAALYQQPVSSTAYVAYLSDNFGLVKSAHAQDQGAGFGVLTPIRELWLTARNLTFTFLVIVFILIGVGIMLRVKIDPRTVMSIQNQLPKIVIAVIMITFSYAIAGLLIDGMWLTTYAGINIISDRPLDCQGQLKPGREVVTVASKGLLNDPIAYVTDVFGDETGCLGSNDGIIGIAGSVGATLGDVLSRTIINSIPGLDAELDDCDPKLLKPDVQDCVKKGFFGVIKYFVSILLILILIVAILIALFRLWIVLIRSFVYVVLGSILGPLWIVMGLLPGSTLGFGAWLRFMAAHLLVFPAAVGMIVIARVIYVNGSLNNPATSFIPPLLGNPNALDNFGNLIALGIIFITPEVLNLLRDALKTQPNKFITPAIYKGVGRGAGPVIAPLAGIARQSVRFDRRTGEAGALSSFAVRKVPRLRQFLDRGRENFRRSGAQQTTYVPPETKTPRT